jgi:hypothetical protein
MNLGDQPREANADAARKESMRTRSIHGLVALCLILACDKSEPGATGQPGSDPSSAAESAPPDATAAASGTSPAGTSSAGVEEAGSLELQELTFTSEVKNKEPVDTLLAAEPGKRVWVHLRLRNRDDAPRKIGLEFRVNGDKRTTLDLKVEKSWSYRTWAYNTLLEGDKQGTVSLEVRDDTGVVLADRSVPIATKARTKAYVKKAP